jgi:hypothetical protein
MKASDTTIINQASNRRQSHADQFGKVMNGRKRPIRGLWAHNGR